MGKFRKKQYEFKERSSPLWWLTAPFRRWFRWLTPSEDDFRERPAGFLPLLARILAFPFQFVFHALYLLLTSWSASRSGRAFVRGLPALLTVVAVLSVVAIANYFYRNLVYNRYASTAQGAMKREEFTLATFCWKRLARERPYDEQMKYNLALAQWEDGERDKAWSLMNRLAPLSDADSTSSGRGAPAGEGFWQAHYWIASQYLSGEALVGPAAAWEEEKRLKRSIEHLDSISSNNRDHIQVVLQKARAYDALGNTEKAIRFYEAVVRAEDLNRESTFELTLFRCSVAPRLIKLLCDSDRPDDADRSMQNAIEQLEPLSKQRPRNLRVWALLVRCRLANKCFESNREMAERFNSAHEAVQDALKINTDPLAQYELRKLMSGLFVEFAKEFGNEIGIPETFPRFEQQFRLLAYSVRVSQSNPEPIDMLIELALPRETENEEIDLWLREATTNVPVVKRTLLGSRAAVGGDVATAHSHFKLAREIDSFSAELVNAIGQRLTSSQHDRVEAAAKLIDVAKSVWPDVPNFNVTRGMILMEQERYQEARQELEYAVTKLEQHLPLREALAECYAALGEPVLAEEQRARAKELEEKLRKQREALAARLPYSG